jgi:acetyl-CoA carboxylase biotin carboxyl carrier protein
MADASKGSPMRIDTALVKQLAALLDENNLTEIEVEDGDRKIKVQRAVAGSGGAALSPAQIAAFGMRSPVDTVSPPVQPAETPAASQDEAAESGTPVKSPMVGTAFLSPEPGAKSFVAVGDKVKAGDTLMIIEAMKVMNPITAPVAGTVNKIAVVDAQPVEFDQVLALIG